MQTIRLGKRTEERGLALVDVGASRTSINVLSGGETCFSREIGIGGVATARECRCRTVSGVSSSISQMSAVLNSS